MAVYDPIEIPEEVRAEMPDFSRVIRPSDDQVERAAKAIAEAANGGGFYDPLFYAEEHRKFWRKVVRAGLEAAFTPDS